MAPRGLLRRALGEKFYTNFLCAELTLKTISRNLLFRKLESEIFILHRLIRPGAVCLDIGAAYGRYTLFLSRLAGPEGRVYSFEPGALSYRVLSNALRFHRLQNVIPVQKALSSRPGWGELAIPVKKGDRLGLSLAHLEVSGDGCRQKTVTEKVPVTTVDSFVADHGLQRVDFIKCDVEGGELSVFQGAEKVLERDRPALLCEVDRSFLAALEISPRQLHQFFSQLGYRASRLNNSGHLEEVKHLEEPHNYFFVHPEGVSWRNEKN